MQVNTNVPLFPEGNTIFPLFRETDPKEKPTLFPESDPSGKEKPTGFGVEAKMLIVYILLAIRFAIVLFITLECFFNNHQ